MSSIGPVNRDPAAIIPQYGRVAAAGADGRHPDKEHVGGAPAEVLQRRKARSRPKPDADLHAWGDKAAARVRARPHAPGITLVPRENGGEEWASPHSDGKLWALQLADAFGTRSVAVVSTFLAQLQSLLGQGTWDEELGRWRYDENEFSAIIAMVNSIRPKNEMEAALAAQMVAVHLMQIKMSAQALTLGMDEKSVSLAGKLARTFAMQTQSLQALRGKSKTARQNIKVSKELHQHVHYHPAGGGQQIPGQPHGAGALPVAERTTLPGTEQSGQPVRITSRTRKTRV